MNFLHEGSIYHSTSVLCCYATSELELGCHCTYAKIFTDISHQSFRLRGKSQSRGIETASEVILTSVGINEAVVARTQVKEEAID